MVRGKNHVVGHMHGRLTETDGQNRLGKKIPMETSLLSYIRIVICGVVMYPQSIYPVCFTTLAIFSSVECDPRASAVPMVEHT